MGALAPLNLLVVLGANLPPEALGEPWPREEDAKGKYQHGPPPADGDDPGRAFLEELPGGWREPPPPGSSAHRPFPRPPDRADSRTAARHLPGLLGHPSAPDSRAQCRNPRKWRQWAPPAPSHHWAAEAPAGSPAPLSPPGPPPGFETGTAVSSGQGRSAPPPQPSWAPEGDEDFCLRACPGMVMVPESILGLGGVDLEEDAARRKKAAGCGKVTLVMSSDNVAALAVICSLSVLGAIYLWKLCTRRHCVCRICRNQYRTLHLLGAGGYGSVYLVERLNDGSRFVSKKIPVHDITEVDEYSREAKELVTLRHRHIVSYEEDFVHIEYGALEPKTFFIIVMEYCPEGDLKEKIEVDFNSFTEEWVRTVFAQLLQAVQYLHSKNVIHRDLKSQNVFLAHDGRVRLGDFGLCRRTPRTPALASATLTHAGTDCYMAPEMLSSSRYGKPADMWSLGCVLYELCAGQFMWELDGILGAMVMKDAQTVPKLLQENLVPAVGSAMASLIRRLLSINPAVRPTATACIRKKVFKKGFPLSRQSFGEAMGEEQPQDSEHTPPPHKEGSEAESAEETDVQERTPSDEDGEALDAGEAADPDGEDTSSGEDDDDAVRAVPMRGDPLLGARRRRRRRPGRR